jgi:hypothetical protein
MQLADLFRRVLSFLPWRRAHDRRRTTLAVDWRVFGSAVHRVSPAADFSCGGAFVRTAEPKQVDTPLVLALTTPRGNVEVHARVAWTGALGMGVRFMRALPADLA